MPKNSNLEDVCEPMYLPRAGSHTRTPRVEGCFRVGTQHSGHYWNPLSGPSTYPSLLFLASARPGRPRNSQLRQERRAGGLGRTLAALMDCSGREISQSASGPSGYSRAAGTKVVFYLSRNCLGMNFSHINISSCPTTFSCILRSVCQSPIWRAASSDKRKARSVFTSLPPTWGEPSLLLLFRTLLSVTVKCIGQRHPTKIQCKPHL